jgi:hypothetical protein
MPTSAAMQQGIQQNKESSRMTMNKPDLITHDRESRGANSSFDLFTMNDAMWSPYWTVAKALLRTQRNSLAYLEANRRLVDAMRTFARREQKLALEVSDKVLKAMSAPGLRPNRDSISQSAAINGAFERGLSGVRELGEFCIDAQMRSLDVIRPHQDAPLGDAQESEHVHAEAA